jgi:hypothetical protein
MTCPTGGAKTRIHLCGNGWIRFFAVLHESHAVPEQPLENSEKHTMLRTVRKTVGGALALLCLASTLVMAQGQTMTCIKDNGMNECVVGMGSDGKAVIVVGEGIKTGQQMGCEDRGYMVSCEKL